MEVVEKDGQRMLRASAASEFLITLPERLPARFTLEFDPTPLPGVAVMPPIAPVTALMAIPPTTGTITPMPAPAPTGIEPGVRKSGSVLNPYDPPPPLPTSTGPRSVSVSSPPTNTSTAGTIDAVRRLRPDRSHPWSR